MAHQESEIFNGRAYADETGRTITFTAENIDDPNCDYPTVRANYTGSLSGVETTWVLHGWYVPRDSNHERYLLSMQGAQTAAFDDKKDPAIRFCVLAINAYIETSGAGRSGVNGQSMVVARTYAQDMPGLAEIARGADGVAFHPVPA